MLTVSSGVKVLYFNMIVTANTTRTHKRLAVKISNTKKEGEKSVYPQRSKACQTKIGLVTAVKWLKSRFSLTGKKAYLFKAWFLELRCFFNH